MSRTKNASRRMATCLLALAVTLAACRDSGQGDYVNVSGKIFVFNYRIAEATYLLTLAKLRKIPDGSSLETTFENPAGGDPFVVRQDIWPTMDKITVESPPVKCVKANREYQVTMRLEDAKGVVLQTIERKMISDTDQSLMPDKPLVVGPFYDPNPDKQPAPPTICPA
ncbi:hypothetical protein SAMN05428967_0017 [Phyllobacterium sp. YR620]|uniref:hypothetical protein n=1 Tax=unclassified Phyllobacterium TaxID=2638441 RepID=UPI000483CD6A|nr:MULTISPECIES: hypothetical protein [unclassified Phyllobacterium]SDO76678.1 hypothetical protein SAMN05428967_0017 [Phyllobacterium sp. YR620]